MSCDFKQFSIRSFLFVIKHVFDIEIILHIIPNVDRTNMIPLFHFLFPRDFIESYSINFKHKTFHNFLHSHTIVYTLYLNKLKVQKVGTFSDTLPSDQFTISRE